VKANETKSTIEPRRILKRNQEGSKGTKKDLKELRRILERNKKEKGRCRNNQANIPRQK